MPLAGATMVLRILFVAGLIDSEVLLRLAVPLSCAGVALAVFAAYLFHQHASMTAGSGGLTLENPFDLAVVLKFGLLLTAVSVLAKFMTGYAGHAGAYVLAAISSVADVDAISLSMARLASGPLGADAAATAIAIAAAGNTLSKSVIGYVTGGPAFGSRLMIAAASAITTGFAGFLLAR